MLLLLLPPLKGGTRQKSDAKNEAATSLRPTGLERRSCSEGWGVGSGDGGRGGNHNDEENYYDVDANCCCYYFTSTK
jgi:hypothetical protein